MQKEPMVTVDDMDKARFAAVLVIVGLALVFGAMTLPPTFGPGPMVLLVLIGTGLAIVGIGLWRNQQMSRAMASLHTVDPPRSVEPMELSFIEDRRTGVERRTGRDRREGVEVSLGLLERRRGEERRVEVDRRDPLQDFVIGLA